jgi:hypothetical protein
MMGIRWIKLGDDVLLNLSAVSLVTYCPATGGIPDVITFHDASGEGRNIFGERAIQLWNHLLAGAWTPPASGEPETTENAQ